MNLFQRFIRYHFTIKQLLIDLLIFTLLIFVNDMVNVASFFDYKSALKSTLQNGDYVVLEEDEKANWKENPTSDMARLNIENYVNDSTEYAVNVVSSYSGPAVFTDDDTIPEMTCVVDYETYQLYGIKNSIIFTGDFYSFSLPISSHTYSKSGVFINSRSLEDMPEPDYIESYDVVGSNSGFSNSYFSNTLLNKTKIFSESSFNKTTSNSIDILDDEIVYGNINEKSNLIAGDNITFLNLDDDKSISKYKDKFIDMHSLFPNGLICRDAALNYPYAIISDSNYDRIFYNTHAYSALAVKISSANKSAICKWADSNNKGIRSYIGDNKRIKLLDEYVIERSAVYAEMTAMRVVTFSLLMAFVVYLGHVFFKENEKELTLSAMLGENGFKSSFPLFIVFLFLLLFGFVISLGASELTIFLINLNANTNYWFTLYSFGLKCFLIDIYEIIGLNALFLLVLIIEYLAHSFIKRVRNL